MRGPNKGKKYSGHVSCHWLRSEGKFEKILQLKFVFTGEQLNGFIPFILTTKQSACVCT